MPLLLRGVALCGAPACFRLPNDFENQQRANMARPALYATSKTSDFHAVDLAWLRRKGARRPGRSGTIQWSTGGRQTGSIGYTVEHGGVRLNYSHTPRGSTQPIPVDELIPIVTTPMQFGGCRHWFTCLSCGRRCRIIYGGARFRCRLCYGAKYESQYQHQASTVCDIRWAIRRRLEERGGTEWPLGLDDGFPPKPLRMQWRTYRRFEARDAELAKRWRIGIAGWLERWHPKPGARGG
jgi:hypothetical protein